MKKQHFLFVLILEMVLFSFWEMRGQDRFLVAPEPQDSIVVGDSGADKRYREDQFYLGLTFNFLDDLPKDVRQSGFSGGLHAGFIRDIPLNKLRNRGLGIGLGWSINSFRTNLLVSESEEGKSIFQVLDDDSYDYRTNRFSTFLVEMPIQFRWRTSHPDSFRFWRIYTGFQLGYIYYFQSKFVQVDQDIRIVKPEALNRLRYGINFTFGYNTFNFTLYYSLNSIFDGYTLEGRPVGLKAFKVGMMFYIL